jgi:hypothetical protein
MGTEYLGNAYLADVTINLDKGHIFEAEVL